MKGSSIKGGSGGSGSGSQLEQLNSEVFTLTYGSLVRQLLADYDSIQEIHKQLDKMGYNIGIRLVDDFLSKSRSRRCASFRETADVVAKQGFQMFLNISAEVRDWSTDGKECSIVFWDNPLSDFVELPLEYKELKYSNILCGVIRGALEMLNMYTECDFRRDMLRGEDCYEIRIKLISYDAEQYPFKDDD